MARKKDENSDMQLEQHQKTYEGFIRFSAIGTVAVFNFLLCILLLSFADGIFSKWIAGLGGIIATLIASAIGIAAPNASWRPNAILLVGLGLVSVFTFAG